MCIFIKATKWSQMMIISLLLISSGSSRLRLGPFSIYEDNENTTQRTTTFIGKKTTPRNVNEIVECQISGWTIYKEYFVPIFSLSAIVLFSVYLFYRMLFTLHLHFKYRRFRFTRRTASERAAIQKRNMIIEMDPLSARNVNHEVPTTSSTGKNVFFVNNNTIETLA